MDRSQLILDLGKIDTYDANDFYISKSNKNVSLLIKSTDEWYNNSGVIFGKRKSGKTHLLNIWLHYNNAKLIDCSEIKNWKEIATDQNVALDNFHNLKNEEDFFHFYNNLIQNKKYLLVSVCENSNFYIKLNDLRSRFMSFTSAKIEDPEDDLLEAIIMKFFSNAQVRVEKNVVKFIISRVERDYQKLNELLETVNEASLQKKSKISIYLLKDLMKKYI